MRAVIQRVSRGKVSVDDVTTGEIGKGLVVLLGVGQEDNDEDLRYIADKVVNLRIFEDETGRMNLSLLDIKGEVLAVSQFTLYGDCRKGRRPSYSDAAPAEKADGYYRKFIEMLRGQGITVGEGKFQAHMMVEIFNDGPVTLLLDSRKEF